MEIDLEELDASMVFIKCECIKYWTTVPLRFISPDVEARYKQWNQHRQTRFVQRALSIHMMFTVLLMLLRVYQMSEKKMTGKVRDFTYLDLVVCIDAAVMLLAAAALRCFHGAYPLWLTARRRLVIAMLFVAKFHVASRESMQIHFGIPLTSEESSPPLVWAAMALIIVNTIICSTAFSRVSESWVLYPFSTLISAAVRIPVIGSEILSPTTFIMLLFVILAHLHVTFMAQCSAELNERRVFLSLHQSQRALVEEKVLRVTVERQAEEAAAISVQGRTSAERSAHRLSAADEVSQFSSTHLNGLYKAIQKLLIEPSSADDQVEALTILAELGECENWLIHQHDLTVLPDRPLGFGGYGCVMTGVMNLSPVAVKVPISQDSMKHRALAMELRHLRKLRHPGIASFLGACILPAERELLLVQEIVVGCDLAKLVDRFGSVATGNVRLRRHLILCVSSALHYLHTRQPAIVHGDLKPRNILVEAHTLDAKLTDFGLAGRELTRDIVFGGTKKWQEPDLRQSESKIFPVQCCSDIWSLGAVVFFMCTGTAPRQAACIYGAASVREFGKMVSRLYHGSEGASGTSRKRPIYVSADLDLPACHDLCSSCMHTDKKQRPTAEEIYIQLRDAEPYDTQAKPLPRALSELRERMNFMKQHPDGAQLPPALMQQLCTELYDKAPQIKTYILEHCQFYDTAVTFQTLHAILQMLSWEMDSTTRARL